MLLQSRLDQLEFVAEHIAQRICVIT
jgi:hypothetical protein